MSPVMAVSRARTSETTPPPWPRHRRHSPSESSGRQASAGRRGAKAYKSVSIGCTEAACAGIAQPCGIASAVVELGGGRGGGQRVVECSRQEKAPEWMSDGPIAGSQLVKTGGSSSERWGKMRAGTEGGGLVDDDSLATGTGRTK